MRRVDLRASRRNYRVVHVFLVTSRRELLVHKLAAERGEFSGRWGSSVAGTVQAHESPGEAALRELKEELGVVLPVRFIGKMPIPERGAIKFLYLYAALHDGAVVPDPSEISLIDYIPLGEIRAEMRRRPFTPTFERAMDLFEREARA
jgi:8-oxo-dGTP pyrophosphatase MutT (NUDIX family)